jgi:hypothetical protein
VDAVEERAQALRSDAEFMESLRGFMQTRMTRGVDLQGFMVALRAEFASDTPGHPEALRLVLLEELRAQNAEARERAEERERERLLRKHLREISHEAQVGVGEAVYAAGVGTIEELLRAEPERLDDLAERLGVKWGVVLTGRGVLQLAGWP